MLGQSVALIMGFGYFILRRTPATSYPAHVFFARHEAIERAEHTVFLDCLNGGFCSTTIIAY
jgi:hypothetical protein